LAAAGVEEEVSVVAEVVSEDSAAAVGSAAVVQGDDSDA